MPASQSPMHPDELASLLEQEIRQLELELREVEDRLNAFTRLVRGQLAEEISLLNQLTELYKAQKKVKKEKRQEQKKRGKNYRQPLFSLAKQPRQDLRPFRNDELKQLYKEAIVRVHPDRYVTEDEATTLRATEVTAELNALYRTGDLEALRDYHDYILSGNAMSSVPFARATAPDPPAGLPELRKKRSTYQQRLHEIKASHLYEVMTTYDDPDRFIGELRQVYAERIQIFQKRTRTRNQQPQKQ